MVAYASNGMVNVQCVCPWCKGANFVLVKGEQLDKWQSGTLIQDAFPLLSADERELLMTGICPECWNKM